MSDRADLHSEIDEDRIQRMVEEAGPLLARHPALDFSGFNFEAIRQAVTTGKAASYLPGSAGKIPPLPESNDRGEIVFEIGPTSMAIPAAFAPYVRYVHEVFGNPGDSEQAEFGEVLGYFHTLRQWVGTLPGTLEDQIVQYLARAPAEHEEMNERIRGYADLMSGDPNFEVVAQVPHMFAHLCRLLLDPDVPAQQKVDISMGIVYFASPVDIVPEAFVDHPVAFSDDACVAVWVLRALEGSDVPREVVERSWPGEATLPVHVDVWDGPLRELLGEDLVDTVNMYFAMKRGRRSLGPSG